MKKSQPTIIRFAIIQGYRTAAEVAFVTGLPFKTVSNRLSELARVGRVKRTGVLANRHGRPAYTYGKP